MVRQVIHTKKTTTKTTTTTRRKPGRPKGVKDSQPRKTRSDKGKKRGSYAKES